MNRVAILCCDAKTVYAEIEGVDLYDQKRNCLTFAGGCPVVAHPPCRAWSAFTRHQAKPPEGEAELAVWCAAHVINCGGVLEHPAYSRLWDVLQLPKPGEHPRNGIWSIAVQQNWFGDDRIKRTWLLISKVDPRQVDIPYALHGGKSRAEWNKMSRRRRASTPGRMAQWLVDLARQVP